MKESRGLEWGGAQTISGLVVVLVCASGCFSPPRRAADVMADPPSAISQVDGATRAAEPRLSSGFWKQEGARQPRVALAPGRRVAITQFDVELVQLQFQPRLPMQLVFKPPLIVPLANPVGWAFIPIGVLDAIGVGRKMTDLAEDQQKALAHELATVFANTLSQRGLEVIPQEALVATPAYGSIAKQPTAKSSWLMVVNPVGIDTGVVLRTRTVTAPGLDIWQAEECEEEAARLRILQETGADVGLAVRLRVGLYRGKPALEQRSTICITTRQGTTVLRARHSLMSDLITAKRAQFKLLLGRVQIVEPNAFSAELAGMLTRFVNLAFADAVQ